MPRAASGQRPFGAWLKGRGGARRGPLSGQVQAPLLPCDAAFEVYEFLEAEGFGYTIRLPANRVLQDRIGHLLLRPVGRPPHYVRRFYESFFYQAQTWERPRRVVAKVEWHPGSMLS